MSSQSELNHPSLKSPIPCVWGATCCYAGCCRYVHPGEEGTGRKLFPGRVALDKSGSAMFWEPPVVRLIGASSFYERRRKGYSWPQWIVYKQKQMQMQMQKQKQMAYYPHELDAVFPKDEKEKMRDKLFPVIYQAFMENKYTILECGMAHREMTPGKIVDKMLETNKLDELEKILNDTPKIADAMYRAYEIVLEGLKKDDTLYPMTYSRKF